MSNPPASHFLPSENLEREAHWRGDSEWLRQQLSNSPHFIFVWQGCNLFSTGRACFSGNAGKDRVRFEAVKNTIDIKPVDGIKVSLRHMDESRSKCS